MTLASPPRNSILRHAKPLDLKVTFASHGGATVKLYSVLLAWLRRPAITLAAAAGSLVARLAYARVPGRSGRF